MKDLIVVPSPVEASSEPVSIPNQCYGGQRLHQGGTEDKLNAPSGENRTALTARVCFAKLLKKVTVPSDSIRHIY